jgi:hypothetical protein
MPILAVHDTTHPEHPDTMHHQCVRCGHERYLRIDPLLGDLLVDTERRSISTAPCPGCAERERDEDGRPLTTTEHFRTTVAPWEAQEPLPADHPLYARWGGIWQHPGSLVGVTFDNTRRNPVTGEPIGPVFGAVVEEHTEGYDLTEEHVTQCQHIRALLQHPHMSAYVPLDDSVHMQRHELATRQAQAPWN